MPAPQLTSPAQIVAVASSLLEEGGSRAVTMLAVATRVGVRAPSLYKHVRDREALLVAVADGAATEVADRLERARDLPDLVRTYRAFALERPEAFKLLFTVDDPTLLTRASSPVLDAVRVLVGPGEHLEAARTVTAWAAGFITMELAGAFRLGGDIDAAFEYGLAMITASLSA